MSTLQYPIGHLTIGELDEAISENVRAQRIVALAGAPTQFEQAVAGLSAQQCDTPYRPGGWSIRQVIHHMADSHLQAYVIFKLALTDDQPLLRMYDCTAWGEFEDAKTEPIEVSIELLRALHVRWNRLLQSMAAEQFSRSFERPEWGGFITLDNLLQLLEWHQRHHLAHISSLRERMGWL